MKKTYSFISALLGLTLFGGVAFAATNVTLTKNGGVEYLNYTGDSLVVGNTATTTNTRLEVNGTTTALVFNATSTTATSTFANGINLTTKGCFAVNGTCLSGVAYSFTPSTNYGATQSATGTALWGQAGFYGSSTSYFVNVLHVGSTTFAGNATSTGFFSLQGATTTAANGLSISTGCFAIAGTCLTAGALAGGATQAVNYATNAVLAGTPTYANGVSGVGATLTEVGVGAISIDGSSPTLGQRILVKNQADQTQNGIYDVTTVGSGIASYVLTRSTDYNTPTEITPGINTYVLSGTANTDTTWAVSFTLPLTIGSSNLSYTESATLNHAQLTNLAWSSSGHTGTANGLAAFNSSGAAISFATSSFNVGTLTFTSGTGTDATTTNSLWSLFTTGDLGRFRTLTATGTGVLNQSSFQNFTFVNATGTNASTTNSLWALFNTGDLGRYRTLTATGTGVLNQSSFQNFTFVNATGTNATSTGGTFAVNVTGSTGRFAGVNATSTGVTYPDTYTMTRGSFDFGTYDYNGTTTDILTIRSFPFATTIRQISGVIDCPNGCSGLGTVGYTIKFWHGLDRSASTTATALFTVSPTFTSTTTLQTFSTGFNDSTLAAGEIMWMQIIAASTTQMSVDVTGVATYD